MMEICDKEDAKQRQQIYIAAKDLVEELQKQNLHIATAESCTGGMVAAGIVDISGASRVFEEGYVTYSNRVKQKLLQVKQDTLDRYTVVSHQTAAEMAAGMQEQSGADLTISVTGYAGPDDGEDGTPAGTVYIGTWYAGTIQTKKYHFVGDRGSCRRQAAIGALQFGLERIRGDE